MKKIVFMLGCFLTFASAGGADQTATSKSIISKNSANKVVLNDIKKIYSVEECIYSFPNLEENANKVLFELSELIWWSRVFLCVNCVLALLGIISFTCVGFALSK